VAKKNEPTAAERAVTRFNTAKDALHQFLKDEDIRDVLSELEHLVEQYNQKLDDAVRLVKAMVRHSDQNKVFIDGIGAQKKFKRFYDAEFLANVLPADQFDEFATERIIYELDIDRLEQLVRQGEVDGVIVEESRRVEEQNPSSLPGTPKPYTIPAIPVGDE
jgi:hypothetical protein